MGAWATSNFANDAAIDWVAELEGHNDLEFIKQTIASVLVADYIESDTASEALVAIEAVAALKGKGAKESSYSQGLLHWAEEQSIDVPAPLIALSLKALDAIVDDTSELSELWQEGEHYDDWLVVIADLRSRVSG